MDETTNKWVWIGVGVAVGVVFLLFASPLGETITTEISGYIEKISGFISFGSHII